MRDALQQRYGNLTQLVSSGGREYTILNSDDIGTNSIKQLFAGIHHQGCEPKVAEQKDKEGNIKVELRKILCYVWTNMKL